MSNMTLKEYIAYLIKKDCEGGTYSGKKVDWRRNSVFKVCLP
jgi:hypothetical protein